MFNKRKFISSLLLLLTSCGGGSGSSSQAEIVTLELNGDSILYGPGLNKVSIVLLKELKPKWIVIDKAVGGLTLNALYKGYIVPYLNAKPEVFPLGPQLPFRDVKRNSKFIVIEVGGNDAYNQLPAEIFEAQLREMISILKSENRVPIITGIPGMIAGDTFNQDTVDRILVNNAIMRKVTKEMNVIHAGWDTYPFNPLTDTIDGIHRSQEALNNLVIEIIKSIDNYIITNG